MGESVDKCVLFPATAAEVVIYTKGMNSERTWIIKIAMNVYKDFLRSSRIKKVFPFGNIKIESSCFDVGDKVAGLDDNRILFIEVIQQSKSKSIMKFHR